MTRAAFLVFVRLSGGFYRVESICIQIHTQRKSRKNARHRGSWNVLQVGSTRSSTPSVKNKGYFGNDREDEDEEHGVNDGEE